ncbi:MAG: hypothetical protein QOI73_777 [Solirubrobacteraceae bacterium]|nr:hypothetical protein [Solirubrobacteraceae bacterium]
MATAAIAAAALAVLSGPDATERRAACLPPGSRTLAATAGTRVYALRGRSSIEPLACLRRAGHAVELGDGYGSQGPFAISGDLVAFGERVCTDPSFGCLLEVQVYDVAAGGLRDASNADVDAYQAGAIGEIVLRRDGVAAWITCDGVVYARNGCPGRGLRSVVTFGRHSYGPRRLARGRIRSGSLRLSANGKRVSWIDGATRRSATLEP